MTTASRRSGAFLSNIGDLSQSATGTPRRYAVNGGQPPLSPAIARRLLTHFRHGSGGEGPASGSGFSTSSGLTTSKPVPLETPPDHERLTPRESEVLTYLSKGFTIKEIASLMGIKWFTVNDHIKSIYKKLNVSSRAEAAVLASKQGLV